jgi:hypothetical protein
VAIPFTTPFLGGVRARPGDRRNLELIVPNPSGGRGVYVMAWASIASLGGPTLHDKVFNKRIAGLHSVTPGMIRRIAREIAAEGLAGDAAMEAARQAADTERDDRVTTNYQLLMTLIEQNHAAFGAPGATDRTDHRLQARQTIADVAPRLQKSTAWTAWALEALAEVMTDTGVGSGTGGRIPRVISMLRGTRASIADWSKSRRNDEQLYDARMVCRVADLTLSLSDNTLAQVHAMTNEMLGLLRAWASDPAKVARLSARPEWLLDGWEKICLIWNYAQDDASRRAALLEIVDLLPVLPKEARDWCGAGVEFDAAETSRRTIRLNEDWRTGEIVIDLVARNEHFRAVAC